ncbi:MAG: 23S rRNA (pseudouridine(1915)-N(3))-methyltransferase RlmH [Immundisolibacteraceae bacterium]|nr:23S rRNA (pseudouridine(1915)-N(3))-methyltransferase RlmH [Immundisolibacteraceae bacterium]
MQLEIVAVGKKMPGWVDVAFADYQRRFPRNLPVKLQALEASRRTATVNQERGRQVESEQLIAAVASGSRIICLDQGGKSWSTAQVSSQLADWMQDGRSVSLLIGGADGMTEQCLQQADQCWSLSPLTLPHPMVRVILIEQLYRGWSMLQNMPYHRA